MQVNIGNFIEAQYKYGGIHGIVTKVLKNKVEIIVYKQYYKQFTNTGKKQLVTASRIRSYSPNLMAYLILHDYVVV